MGVEADRASRSPPRLVAVDRDRRARQTGGAVPAQRRADDRQRIAGVAHVGGVHLEHRLALGDRAR